MSDPMQEQDIQMDADNLCREDVFTDNRVGTVRQALDQLVEPRSPRGVVEGRIIEAPRRPRDVLAQRPVKDVGFLGDEGHRGNEVAMSEVGDVDTVDQDPSGGRTRNAGRWPSSSRVSASAHAAASA